MKVFGIAGYSGSGKTTLMERLIPAFAQQGLKVSVIKHAHHHFDIDRPGKDSYRHREAGAFEVLISNGQRWALMHEVRGEPEATLEQLLLRLSPCDIVLVEGFKKEPVPKLEVHRAGFDGPLLYPNEPHIVAVATDEPLKTELPQLDINYPDGVAYFIMNHLGFDVAGFGLSG
jgi:molybdopterin-guanine dinucleotide biosynthesis adapter protein